METAATSWSFQKTVDCVVEADKIYYSIVTDIAEWSTRRKFFAIDCMADEILITAGNASVATRSIRLRTKQTAVDAAMHAQETLQRSAVSDGPTSVSCWCEPSSNTYVRGTQVGHISSTSIPSRTQIRMLHHPVRSDNRSALQTHSAP